MSADLRIDNILIQVRSKLQENGIKLWLSPYYVEDIGMVDAEIEALSTNFSEILSIPYDYCLAAVTELQNNAIDKIRARSEFERTGLASIKVRAPSQVGGTRLVTVFVKLTDLGKQLQENVAKELELSPDRIKLICAGKVLDPNRILEQQDVKNNQQIMAVMMAAPSPTEDVNNECIYDRVQKARDDATILINEQGHDFMTMEDQQGNAIHLPPAEKKSLMMALAMHEKGKAYLKREEYSDALVLLLEADNEYSTCNSKLLETVDNYALLNLDIAWCYLCLKSVTQLPDAEKRLHICERNFKKSYGENFNRVEELKGNAGNEKALIMRLHLLQAVLLFHQNRRNEAQNMLMTAESELRSLKVSEDSIVSLVEMGYSVAEARIGLRACGGNIERSIEHILQNREKRSQARRQAKKENDLMKHVGKSKDETWVNPRNLHVLVDMGFPQDLCITALKVANNDISQAISMIQNNSAELQQKSKDDFIPDKKIVSEMVNMGFNEELINMALRFATNNMNGAVDMLLKMQNDGTYEQLLTSVLGTTSDGAGPSDPLKKILKTKIKDNRAALEAFERFSQDVTTEDDDYLDLPLLKEEDILLEYKKHLLM